MNSEQMRAEINKAKFENEVKISLLSDKYFNVYLVSFAFSNSELQHMFHVIPLREDGSEFPEGFYFINEKRARVFMSEYHDYHTRAWWIAMKKNHHQQYSCLVNFYFMRQELEGGEI